MQSGPFLVSRVIWKISYVVMILNMIIRVCYFFVGCATKLYSMFYFHSNYILYIQFYHRYSRTSHLHVFIPQCPTTGLVFR